MWVMRVLIIVVLSVVNVYAAETYDDEDELSSVLNHWYAEVCPYGNAVITDQKKNTVAIVDCVFYDYKTKEYSTWVGAVDRRRRFIRFEPKHVRIFVNDGELILDHAGHPNVVEYGAMTISDPRFVEWIKTH